MVVVRVRPAGAANAAVLFLRVLQRVVVTAGLCGAVVQRWDDTVVGVDGRRGERRRCTPLPTFHPSPALKIDACWSH